jgi:hypothetical protein
MEAPSFTFQLLHPLGSDAENLYQLPYGVPGDDEVHKCRVYVVKARLPSEYDNLQSRFVHTSSDLHKWMFISTNQPDVSLQVRLSFSTVPCPSVRQAGKKKRTLSMLASGTLSFRFYMEGSSEPDTTMTMQLWICTPRKSTLLAQSTIVVRAKITTWKARTTLALGRKKESRPIKSPYSQKPALLHADMSTLLQPGLPHIELPPLHMFDLPPNTAERSHADNSMLTPLQRDPRQTKVLGAFDLLPDINDMTINDLILPDV